jgi:hypothetical protein
MLLPDGGVYTGSFAADKWEGDGMYEYPDGSCYVGQWQAGKKHGDGACTEGSLFARAVNSTLAIVNASPLQSCRLHFMED